MLPLVYSFGIGAPTALPLDQRQQDEILLTAAQSLFAVALLLDLRLSLRGAGTLFGAVHRADDLPRHAGRLTVVYIVLAAIVRRSSAGARRAARSSGSARGSAAEAPGD